MLESNETKKSNKLRTSTPTKVYRSPEHGFPLIVPLGWAAFASASDQIRPRTPMRSDQIIRWRNKPQTAISSGRDPASSSHHKPHAMAFNLLGMASNLLGYEKYVFVNWVELRLH